MQNRQMKLTCPGCNKHMDVPLEHRLHRCPHCSAVSFCRPETHTLFLRHLADKGDLNAEFRTLHEREHALLQQEAEILETEMRQRQSHKADHHGSAATLRLLVLSFIIATISALLLYGSGKFTVSAGPIVMAAALMLLSIILMLISTTRLRGNEFQLESIVKKRRESQSTRAALQRRIDKAVIGTSNSPAGL